MKKILQNSGFFCYFLSDFNLKGLFFLIIISVSHPEIAIEEQNLSTSKLKSDKK